MPNNDAQRIRQKIQQYSAHPEALSNKVKALQGRDGFRLRVGDWRVIFTRDGCVLTVHRVGSRGEVYR